METILPSGWPRPSGFSHAVSATGQVLFLAGQVGCTPDGQFSSDDLVEQSAQSLRNIRSILEAASLEPAHLVRLTWFVLDKQEYVRRRREIGKIYREIIGPHYPAMTLVQVGSLVDDAALVEIEATAVEPQ